MYFLLASITQILDLGAPLKVKRHHPVSKKQQKAEQKCMQK